MRVKLDTYTLRTGTPPPKGYVLLWDTELGGFGVRITAGGARTFFVEKRVRARKRRVSLGRWPQSRWPGLVRKRGSICNESLQEKIPSRTKPVVCGLR